MMPIPKALNLLRMCTSTDIWHPFIADGYKSHQSKDFVRATQLISCCEMDVSWTLFKLGYGVGYQVCFFVGEKEAVGERLVGALWFGNRWLCRRRKCRFHCCWLQWKPRSIANSRKDGLLTVRSSPPEDARVATSCHWFYCNMAVAERSLVTHKRIYLLHCYVCRLAFQIPVNQAGQKFKVIKHNSCIRLKMAESSRT